MIPELKEKPISSFEDKMGVTSNYITCPYCGAQWTEDVGKEGEVFDIECNQCFNTFMVMKRIIYDCTPFTQHQKKEMDENMRQFLEMKKLYDQHKEVK